MTATRNVPSVSVNYNRIGKTAKANEFCMRSIQARAYEQRGEQHLISPRPSPDRHVLDMGAHFVSCSHTMLYRCNKRNYFRTLLIGAPCRTQVSP